MVPGVAGLALVAGDKAGHPDLASRGIVERPRVLYHAALRRFVMWLHIDDEKVIRVILLIEMGCLWHGQCHNVCA